METNSGQTVAKRRHRPLALQVVALGLMFFVALSLNAKEPEEPLPGDMRCAASASLPFCSPDGIDWCLRSPDGKFFVVRASDYLLIMDAASGRRLRQTPIADPLNSRHAALTPDGKQLVWVNSEGVEVWKTDSLNRDRVLRHGKFGAGVVAVSADGKTTAYTNLNEVRVFRLTDGKALLATQLSNCFESMASLSSDGRFVAHWGLRQQQNGNKFSHELSGHVEIWDVESGKPAFKIATANGMPTQVIFSPDGSRIATCRSGVLQIWDGKNGELIQRTETGVDGDVRLCFSRDGKKIALAGTEGKAAVLAAETGKLIERGITPPATIDGIACDADGVFRAWGHHGNVVAHWEVPSGKPLTPARDHPAGIGDLHFSPDGKLLYSAGVDSSRVLAWDTATGAGPRQLKLGSDRVGRFGQGSFAVFAAGAEVFAVVDSGDAILSVHRGSDGSKQFDCGNIASEHLDRHLTFFSPDGRKLMFLSGFDRSHSVWDVPSGKVVRTLEQLAPGCGWKAGAFSADGKLLAAANSSPGLSSDIAIVDVAAAKPIATAEMHDAQAQSLIFLDERRLLALGSQHGSLYHFDVLTGRALRAFEAVPDAQLTGKLALSRDGRLVAAGARADDDHEGKFPPRVLVWEVASGRLRHAFEGHVGQIEALAFSPDGTRLASGAADTTILLWDLRSAREKPDKSTAKLWVDLDQLDASTAETAIRDLVSQPEATVAFLNENLHPVAKLDDGLIQKLLVDLEADRFAVRDAAGKQLEKIGAPALPAIEKALRAMPGADLLDRLEKLRATIERTDPDEATWRQDLRSLRALESLERIGSTEAREVVKMVAAGADGAKPTRAAREALERLK